MPNHSPDPKLQEPADHAHHVIRSENARLHDFYQTTLSAVSKANAPVRRTRTVTVPGAGGTTPSIVNLSFLTSGQQFSPPPLRRAGVAAAAVASTPDDNVSPLPSTRLEAFHKRTAQAAADAARAGLIPKDRLEKEIST